MNNDTQRVLEMLSEGKITVDEAERLLEALGGHGPTPDQAPDPIPETEAREDSGQKAGGEHDTGEPIGPSPWHKNGCRSVRQRRGECSSWQCARHGGQY